MRLTFMGVNDHIYVQFSYFSFFIFFFIFFQQFLVWEGNVKLYTSVCMYKNNISTPEAGNENIAK